MILVADASALIALSACDSLGLLDALFGQVCVSRKVAKINQIRTIGSLGVLLQAKRAGLIAAVAPLLHQIAASPVFIGADLLQTVLDLAGE